MTRPRSTHQAPPEGVGQVLEMKLIFVLLRLVHEEGGEDEGEKADVPRSQKLLKN